jgi:hypothetical protein
MMGGGRLVDAKRVEEEVGDSDSLDWIGWITTFGLLLLLLLIMMCVWVFYL